MPKRQAANLVSMMTTKEDFPAFFQDAVRATMMTVTFAKVDGTERTMTCTLNPKYIPNEHLPKGGEITEEAELGDSIRVYEPAVAGWRTVTFDRITDFKSATGF